MGHPLVLAELMDDAVRVQLESGPTQTYDFVVGADGVHSAVRRAVLPADNLRQSLMTDASWRFTALNPRCGLLDGMVGSAGHLPAHPGRREPRVRLCLRLHDPRRRRQR